MSEPDVRYLVGEPLGDGPLFTYCPFHDDTNPSMAVYADGTWCFVCGKGERAYEFAKRMGVDDLSKIPERSELPINPNWVPAFDDHRLHVQKHTFWHTLRHGRRKERIHWLLDRGILMQSIDQYRLGHNGFAFTIPLVNPAGKLCGIKYRIDPAYADEESDKPKYWNTRGIKNVPFLCGEGRDLWLVEGEFDAILLGQYGVKALTTSGGAGALHQPQTLEAIGEHKRLYIATDNDEAGNQAFTRVCKKLKRERVKLFRIMQKGNDITDDLLSYSRSQRVHRVRELMEQALPV